jgi:hypothetical protein
MRWTYRTKLRITLPLLALLALAGCAMLDEDNRRLLNAADKAIRPKSLAARVSLAPLAVPAATAILTTDAAIVHPVHSIPKAWDDTYELYWKPRDYDLLRKSLLFVPIVALTPPTFVGDLGLRCMFPID